ncbi:MAG: hypothetical protein U0527_16275 [Candidatus Eisenbacteria bacterium]
MSRPALALNPAHQSLDRPGADPLAAEGGLPLPSVARSRAVAVLDLSWDEFLAEMRSRREAAASDSAAPR